MSVSTNSTVYSFLYDGFGNKTATKADNTVLASYTYDDHNGSLRRMDYGNGDYVTYDYDKYGNLSRKYLNGNIMYEGFADSNGELNPLAVITS